MKKGFLRFIAVVMVVLMTAVYVPVSEDGSAFGVQASAIVTNGTVKLGNNIKWSYDTGSKTITVSGSGDMYNFNNGDDGQKWDELILWTTHYPNKHAKKLVISNGITSIGNNAFNGLEAIESVEIPASVRSIGNSAFKGCSSLKKVVLPSAVTTISNDTFMDCTSLSSVNINEGITSIGANAFRNTKITSVNMPYSVKTIGSNAFSTVSITCNYNDPAYKYCASHANATAVLRTPSLKTEILPGSASDIITVALYVKDASGFNAGNFTIEYNADISPVSSDYIFNESSNVATAVVFGSNNKASVAVSAATQINYADCGSECSYKIAELSFRLAPKTHVAKVTFSSSVFMLCDKRYTPASTFVEYGEHSFVAQGEPVAATCTTYGYTLYECSICEEEREMDIVDAPGHSYGEGVVTSPACETGGYTSYTCSRCKDVIKDSYTEATGHTTREVVIEATCQNKGSKSIVCDSCKKETVADEYEINPDNHVNTEVRNVKAATCSVPGYTGDTYCADCEAMIQQGSATATTAHSYDSVVTDPTCTSKGYTTHTCKACGYSYKDSETAVVEHEYEMTVTKAPTCQAKGEALYECKHCKTSYTQELAVTAHEYEAVVTAPTCQAKGYTTYTCKYCQTSYTADETPVTSHKFAEASRTEATCSAAGSVTYKCETCDEAYSEAIPVTTHSYESTVTDATCKDYGYTTYTCKFCGDTYKVDGEELSSHTYESVVTAATCTQAGFTTFTCSVCGHSYKGVFTAALGHEYDEDGNCIRCYTEPTDATLAFNDTATYIINETDKTVLVRKTLTAADLKAAITTKGWVITAADGSALADDKAVATGCCIKSEDGSLVYKVAILGDVNSDGRVNAADARITLRVAARIDKADDIALLAANCDGKANVTASDARIILRVSARLQSF